MGAAPEAKPQPPPKLGDVLESLAQRTRDAGGRVTLGFLLREFGSRAYGPLLLVPSLLALIPVIGAIPGISVLTGSLIIVIAAQIFVARPSPWLPDRLLRVSVPQPQLLAALERSRRWARPVDRVVEPRYPRLTQPPMLRAVAAVLVLLGILFYPTALIPWGVTAPALAATLLALAVTAHDGLLVLMGLFVSALSLALLVAFWPF